MSPLSFERSGQPKLVLEVEHPADEPVRVLADQGPFAGRDLDAIEVVPGFVPIIQSNIDNVGIGFRNCVDGGPDAFGIGQVAGSRSF